MQKRVIMESKRGSIAIVSALILLVLALSATVYFSTTENSLTGAVIGIQTINGSCNFSISNNVGNLGHDYQCSTPGFYIGADNISIDCQDHVITCVAANCTNMAGILSNNKNNILIKNCRFENWWAGIQIINGTNNSITLNHFKNNTYNVYIQNTSTNRTSAQYHSIWNNNFTTYVNSGYDDGQNFWNLGKNCNTTNIIGGPCLGGNYWSEYNGIDNDGYGFGNIPYPINGSTAQKDEKPLVDPWKNGTCPLHISLTNPLPVDLNSTGECLAIVANNLVFDCQGHFLNGVGGGADDRRGIEIQNMNNITIKNCIIHNFTYGIYIKNSYDITLFNNTIYDNNFTGIYLDTVYRYNLTNNRVYDTSGLQRYGIRVVSGYPKETSEENNSIIGNTAWNNSLYGISLSDNSDYVTISNNIVYNNTFDGIIVNGSYSVIINNNTAYFNGRSGLYVVNSESGIGTINTNTIYNNTQDGIYLSNSPDYRLNGNTVYNNSASGIHLVSGTGLTFEFNNISFNAQSGMRIDSGSSLTIGAGNNIFNNTGNGLTITGISSSRIKGSSSLSSGELVDPNKIYWNTQNGLELNNSNLINLTYNRIYNNTANGLALFNTNNSYIHSNIFSFNLQNGTKLLSSINNNIYNNYFGNNSQNAYDNNATNKWNQSRNQTIGPPLDYEIFANIIGGPWWGGNYWSTYNGSDLTADGIGDNITNTSVSDYYIIPGVNNTDKLPLTNNLAGCGNITNSVNLVKNLTINGSCFVVTGNNITINFGGYYLIGNNTGTGLKISDSTSVVIKDANIINFSTAIDIDPSSAITLNNSNLSYSNVGIQLTDTNNSLIVNNRITNNVWGINVTNSWNNSIYNNYFNNTNNALEADDYNNTWNTSYNGSTTQFNINGANSTGGNFWSDYLGRDSGRGLFPYNTSGDGIGDSNVPYTGLGSLKSGGDHLPLMNNNGTGADSTCLTISQDTVLNNDVNCTSGDGVTITGTNVNFDCNNYRITGGGIGSGIVIDSRSGTIIRNCNITNFYYGIKLLNTNNVQIIQGNNLQQNGFYGIYLYQSNNTIINSNSIINDNNGVYAISSRNTTITNNTINLQKKFYGIYLFNSPINNISANTLWVNYHGIYLVNSPYTNITSNTINSSDAYSLFVHKGTSNSYFQNNVVTTGSEALRLKEGSNSNTFVNNTIFGHSSYGIYSTDSSSNSFTNNTLTNNTKNIYLSASSSNTFTNNSITLSTTGLQAVSSSNSLTLTNNTINSSASPSLSINSSTSAIVKGNRIYNDALLSQADSSKFNTNNTITTNLTILNSASVNISGNSLQYVLAQNDSGLVFGSNTLTQLAANTLTSADFNSNTIANRALTVFDLQKVTSSTIRSNDLQNNTVAILLRNSSNTNIIYHNWIKDNTLGVNITNSTSNTLYNNYFDDPVSDNSQNTWYTTYSCSTPNIVGGPCQGGNFYYNYYGLDNGANSREQGDGIGDEPANFTIASGTVDRYPLVLYVARQYLHPTSGTAASLTASGNTSGALSSVVPNQVQVITYQNSSGAPFFSMTGLFNYTDVDARSLLINYNGTITAINKTGVTGITTDYAVYVHHNNGFDSGVYVCPNVSSLAAANSSCSGIINLNTLGVTSGLNLSIESTYYKISNLTYNAVGIVLNNSGSSCGGVTSHGITLNSDLNCNTSASAVTIQADNVVVDFNNYYLTGNNSGIGINLTGRTNVTVKNTKIRNFATALLVDPSFSINITGCTITNNSIGLQLIQTNNSFVTSNQIYNNALGINLTNSFNNTIYNNYFNNTVNAVSNSSSIWNRSYNCSLGSNIVGGSCLGGNYWSDYAGWDTDGDGVGNTLTPYNSSNGFIGGDSFPLTTVGKIACGNVTTNVTLYQNVAAAGTCFNWNTSNLIFNCAGYTITGSGSGTAFNLSGVNQSTIRNCTIQNFTTGLKLSSSYNNTILWNTIKNNTLGINLSGSTNNSIYNNYFNNTNNAADNSSNKWNISYACSSSNVLGGTCVGGNFWSDYNGSDDGNSTYPHNISSDGIGDTLIPYNNSNAIVSGGDYLPLKYTASSSSGSGTPSTPSTSSSSGGGGGSSSRSTTTNTTNQTICTASWQCGGWEECSAGKQVRNCFDINDCAAKKARGTVTTVKGSAKPSVLQNCPEVVAPVIPPVTPVAPPVQPAPVPPIVEPVKDNTTAIAVSSAALLLVFGGALTYWQLGYAPNRLRRKLRKLDPLLSEESSTILKDDYLSVYNTYLKLSDGQKQNFYARVTKLREKIEEQLTAEKRIEALFTKAQTGDLPQQKRAYLAIYGAYQKLPSKVQEKYYSQVVELRERLERGTRE